MPLKMQNELMQIPWLETQTPLPPAVSAQKIGTPLAGLVAAGGGLSTARLQEAYRHGMFPWFSEGQPVLWWSPDPRMLLRTDEFRLHRSLLKSLKAFREAPKCEIRFNSAFGRVIRHCASSPRQGQSGTWIVPEMISAYEALHVAGFAHSIETWIEGHLVGGLYCVAVGHAVFGESMFAHQSNASKIALAALVAFARAHKVEWIDCQQNTKHLASLGAKEIPRSDFLQKIRETNSKPLDAWCFEPSYWDLLLSKKELP